MAGSGAATNGTTDGTTKMLIKPAVTVVTSARSSQRSEVRTYDRAFDFNHIEDDIVDCLYCNSRVNSVNVSIIRNSGQLKISSRLTLNSKDFDPDRYFYNAHQVTDVLLGR